MAAFTFSHAGEMKWECTLRVAGENPGDPEEVYPGRGSVTAAGGHLRGSFSFKTFSMSFDGSVDMEENSSAVSGNLAGNNAAFDRLPMSGTYTYFMSRPRSAGNGREVLHLSGSRRDLSCMSYDLGAVQDLGFPRRNK